MGRFWHEYTRMRTAIYFLIGILLIVLIGTFVPQEFTSASQKISEFLAAHQNLNDLATHFGLPLTSVFVSPLFYVLLASLYVALLSCVIMRGRALVVRTLRRYPRTPQYWGNGVRGCSTHRSSCSSSPWCGARPQVSTGS